MAAKGKPVTFKDGEIKITPLDPATGNATLASAVNLIASGGSLDDTVAIAEASVNCVGKLRAPGVRDVSIEANAYVAVDGGAGGASALGLKPGDYCNVDLKAGLLHYEGEFIVESFKSSLSAEDFVTMDISFKNSGNPRTSVTGLVSCTGTAP